MAATPSMLTFFSEPSEISAIPNQNTTEKKECTITEHIVLIFVRSIASLVIENWKNLPVDDFMPFKHGTESVFSDGGELESETESDSNLTLMAPPGESADPFIFDDTTIKHKVDDNFCEEDGDSLCAIMRLRLNASGNNVFIKFLNGNSYFGNMEYFQMNGYGVFNWADGSSYEGYFTHNTITGRGKMIWPDLSWYEGEFVNGFRHGQGTYYIAYSDMFFHGEWCLGEKCGNGYLIYNKNILYDGEWYQNFRHGNGEHIYLDGSYYNGEWRDGKRHGCGIMCWSNNDYYKGSWLNGKMHGYGEYIWDVVLNFNFNFPVKNSYKGMWESGLREGLGTLEFGYMNGAKYNGFFKSNLKHGDGIIICGNGFVIRRSPLFLYDKPIHLANNYDYSAPMNRDKMLQFLPERKCVNNSNHKPSTFEENTFCDNDQFKFEQNDNQNDILYYECQTVEIPIHLASHKIDLSYHVKQVVKLNSVFENIANLSLENHEMKCVEQAIESNLPRLWELYNYYSNICVDHDSPNRQRIMIRLFLWQMYRDCKIIKKIPLVRTDRLLAACKTALVNAAHDPFEKIYFWQFLHSLLCIAWEIYSCSFNSNISGGLLAAVLTKMLEEDIYPNEFKNKGYVLFKYRDVVPMPAMYSFYSNISEPLPIKKFLSFVLPQNMNMMATQISSSQLNINVYNGRNTVYLGTHFLYKSDNQVLVDFSTPIQIGDPNKRYRGIRLLFMILQEISVTDIIRILIQECPLIENELCIVGLDYELTFLEFYETLIGCLLHYERIFQKKFVRK